MRIQSCLDLNQWPEYGFSMTITSGLIITTYTSCGGQAQTCHEPMVIYLFFFSPRGNSGAMQGAKELSTWITFKKNQCGRTGAAITVIHFSERHKVFLSDRNWTKQSKDSHEKSEACTYDITAERITGNKQIRSKHLRIPVGPAECACMFWPPLARKRGKVLLALSSVVWPAVGSQLPEGTISGSQLQSRVPGLKSGCFTCLIIGPP